ETDIPPHTGHSSITDTQYQTPPTQDQNPEHGHRMEVQPRSAAYPFSPYRKMVRRLRLDNQKTTSTEINHTKNPLKDLLPRDCVEQKRERRTKIPRNILLLT